MGWFDEHGNLTMLGRHKNRISVAGMKFFAEEVEAVLARHPDIALSRVFSSTHERLGEIPVADVVLRPGSTLAADGVAHFCRKWLSHYKVPREIKVVEQLDFTATGKVKRWG
jgi:acyl-CoA synthetase (AMP-forming)/AMP-acid ligase II